MERKNLYTPYIFHNTDIENNKKEIDEIKNKFNENFIKLNKELTNMKNFMNDLKINIDNDIQYKYVESAICIILFIVIYVKVFSSNM